MGRTIRNIISGRVLVANPNHGETNVYHLASFADSHWVDVDETISTLCGLEKPNYNLDWYYTTGERLKDLTPCSKCLSKKRKVLPVKPPIIKRDMTPNGYYSVKRGWDVAECP